ncbi:MAG: hypothetical protein H6851_07610 [Geminicoccaceae bacterium]|nr:hypothetical protein [Geminicoccaceae bacterium]
MHDADLRKLELECQKIEHETIELRWRRWVGLGNMCATVFGACGAVTVAILKLLE